MLKPLSKQHMQDLQSTVPLFPFYFFTTGLLPAFCRINNVMYILEYWGTVKHEKLKCWLKDFYMPWLLPTAKCKYLRNINTWFFIHCSLLFIHTHGSYSSSLPRELFDYIVHFQEYSFPVFSRRANYLPHSFNFISDNSMGINYFLKLASWSVFKEIFLHFFLCFWHKNTVKNLSHATYVLKNIHWYS